MDARFVDHTAMKLLAVEMSCPWLDNRVWELTLSLPNGLSADFRLKIVLYFASKRKNYNDTLCGLVNSFSSCWILYICITCIGHRSHSLNIWL